LIHEVDLSNRHQEVSMTAFTKGKSTRRQREHSRGATETGTRGQDALERGMVVRRSILGDEHVEKATAAATSLDADFQAYITTSVWGAIWARPGLSRRERSLVTIALLAAQGHDNELGLHLRATERTGATPAEVSEVLLHVAVYAGVPAANHAMSLAKTVFSKAGAPGRPESSR
jgi:4-carboxymuconolactone decarboxylase